MTDSIRRLYDQVLEAREADPAGSRTARLMRDGLPKMAKKVAEEAVEVSLEAIAGNREAVVLESVDLVYNLTVLWAAAGIRPEEIWAEMERRERLLGICEKLPKQDAARAGPARALAGGRRP